MGKPQELDAYRAQLLAERLHRGQRDVDGLPLIDHIRRVAAAVPPHARIVAWLHEVLEHTTTSEHVLLWEGVSAGDLRALRLLARDRASRSDVSYLGYIELIARARGGGANVARAVKCADLEDRLLNPPIVGEEWSPPYRLALEALRPACTLCPDS